MASLGRVDSVKSCDPWLRSGPSLLPLLLRPGHLIPLRDAPPLPFQLDRGHRPPEPRRDSLIRVRAELLDLRPRPLAGFLPLV